MASAFKYGHASAPHWHEAAQDCLSQLGDIPATANLGFIYVTDIFAAHMQEILATVKLATGVPHWVGSAGLGICATGQEYLDKPAIAIMLGEFPEHAFSVFPAMRHLDDLPDAVQAGRDRKSVV